MRPAQAPLEADADRPVQRRRLAARLDPRVRALLASLDAWLPSDIAWDRAMNAASPLLLLEDVAREALEAVALSPRMAIEGALSNHFAMRGHRATDARIDHAARAWARATRPSGVHARCARMPQPRRSGRA